MAHWTEPKLTGEWYYVRKVGQSSIRLLLGTRDKVEAFKRWVELEKYPDPIRAKEYIESEKSGQPFSVEFNSAQNSVHNTSIEDKRRLLDSLASELNVEIKPKEIECNVRLDDLLKDWMEIKRAENRSENHIVETKKFVDEFICFVDDSRLAKLTENDFNNYVLEVEKSQRKGKYTNVYTRDRLAAIQMVFNELSYKYKLKKYSAIVEAREYLARKISGKRVVPAEENKIPIGVAEFQKLLKLCADLRSTPMPDECNPQQKLNVYRARRKGIMWEFIYRLVCQTGFGATDISQLEWRHFADGYVTLGRSKTEATAGVKVVAHYALLPSTIQAMESWKKEFLNQREEFQGPVFLGEGGKPYGKGQVSEDSYELFQRAGIKLFSLQSFRKIPSTIGENNYVTGREIARFLRQVPKSVAEKFYTGELKKEYLNKLINLIGAEYFGETLAAGVKSGERLAG